MQDKTNNEIVGSQSARRNIGCQALVAIPGDSSVVPSEGKVASQHFGNHIGLLR